MQALADPILLAYVGLGTTMLFWGLVPVFLKKLLAVLTPTELSFTRFLLSGLILLGWVIARRRQELVRMFRRDLKLVVLCTVFGPLSAMVFFNYGILNVTVGTAAVMAALEPVITYLLAVAIGQEIWRPQRMLSILLALVGICLVILSRGAWGTAYWISLGLVSLCPAIWAVNNIITKELVARHSPLVMVSASFVLSALFLVPTLNSDYLHKLGHLGPALWAALAYCVFLGTIFGFSIWYWSLKYLAPSTVAVSMYAIPLLSVTGGIVLLGEPMSWLMGSGTATVLLGLYLVNVRYR